MQRSIHPTYLANKIGWGKCSRLHRRVSEHQEPLKRYSGRLCGTISEISATRIDRSRKTIEKYWATKGYPCSGNVLQCVWCQKVIGVEPGEQIATASYQPFINRIALTTILLANPMKTCVVFITLEDCYRLIRAATINYPVLDVRVILSQNTLD